MRLPISVVLCCYNGSHFIKEQAESILKQTHPITELLIVDDASTDDTVLVVKKHFGTDARVKIICNEHNKGFTANFAHAMGLASEALIAIADQDDVWHLRKLERMLDAIEPDTTLLYCDSVRFQNSIPTNPRANLKNRKIAGKDPRKIALYNTISGHAMIIRKSLLEEAMPFPESVYYDWWLGMVAMCTGKVQFLPDILVYQRSHDSNVTIAKGVSERELRSRFREMLVQHLSSFKAIGHMKPGDRHFFTRLYELWHASLSQKWNWQLFLFLMKYRHILYCNKVRKFPFLSQCKHSLLFSFRF